MPSLSNKKILIPSGIPAFGNIRFLLRIFVTTIISALYIFKYDGNDYFMYEQFYYYDEITFDIGYELFAKITKTLGLNFEYFYAIYSTFNIILFGILSRWRTERMLLSLIPLMLFPGLPLNTIRQFTAGLICAIAFDRFYPQQNNKYIFFIFLACQFHFSAILFFLPLATKRLIFFFFIFIGLIATAWIFNDYAFYLTNKATYYAEGTAADAWYEQSTGKSVIFSIISVLFFGAGKYWGAGDAKKYRPLFFLIAIASLLTVYMSIFVRFFYLFIPTISAWMYTCTRRQKLNIFLPLWLIGAINLYFVLVVWSGDHYIHRNYLFNLF